MVGVYLIISSLIINTKGHHTNELAQECNFSVNGHDVLKTKLDGAKVINLNGRYKDFV